jgi:DNA-binding transcriptional ArsR family regulator
MPACSARQLEAEPSITAGIGDRQDGRGRFASFHSAPINFGSAWRRRHGDLGRRIDLNRNVQRFGELIKSFPEPRLKQQGEKAMTITSEVGTWNGPPPLPSAGALISRGRLEALHFVPFHANGAAPVSRRVLAGAGVHETIGKHIVSHEIRDVPAERRSYCEPHVHDCDEINILLSDSHLSYEIRLGEEVFVVNAPATIHIPAGVIHSANVIEGTGFFIAIVDTDNYKASVGSGTARSLGDNQPNEAALTSMINGYWMTQMIYTAARLGIADVLAEEPQTVSELAARLGVHQPSLYRLLRALASRGIFTEREDGCFDLTPMAELLRTDVPGSLHGLALYSGAPEQHRYDSWGDLYETIRTGEPAFHRLVGTSPFAYLAANPDTARTFDAAMASYTAAASSAILARYDFSRHSHVVDVGGGNGRLLADILRRHHMLRGTLFDLDHVASRARTLFEREGLAARINCVTGNFHQQVPSGGDLYMLKNILHDWADDRAIAILRACRAAMSENSRLLILESVLRPGNEPGLGKLMDMNMLVIHGGLERTEAEYASLLRKSGFVLTKVRMTGSVVDLVEALPV